MFTLMTRFCVEVRFNLFSHPASIIKSITMGSSILGEGCHSEDKIKQLEATKKQAVDPHYL